MPDAFSSYHPAVSFLYFTLVIVFSMFFTHPVCLAIALAGALAYGIYLSRKKATRFHLLYLLPLLIFTACLNPIFNHAGGTILSYLPDGNPLTLESIAYGAVAAAMLITVIAWFSCYNAVMSTDKFVYLFGRLIPAMSLIFSMTLRFIPRFREQFKTVSNAQKCIGRDLSNGSLLTKARQVTRVLSAMVTWALENTVETADSMRSRGYGLPGRTAFSIYRFAKRDMYATLFFLSTGGYIAVGACTGGLYYRYFPTMQGVFAQPYSLSLYAAYGTLCLAPVIMNIWEDSKWRALRSTI